MVCASRYNFRLVRKFLRKAQDFENKQTFNCWKLVYNSGHTDDLVLSQFWPDGVKVTTYKTNCLVSEAKAMASNTPTLV